MKSIWIPLALCASLAPLPVASAAQHGQDSADKAIERAERELAEAQARLEELLSKSAPKITWEEVEAPSRVAPQPASPHGHHKPAEAGHAEVPHLAGKTHDNGTFWEYGSGGKASEEATVIIKHGKSVDGLEQIIFGGDGPSCESAECESAEGAGSLEIVIEGTPQVMQFDMDGLDIDMSKLQGIINARIGIEGAHEGNHQGFEELFAEQNGDGASIMLFGGNGKDFDMSELEGLIEMHLQGASPGGTFTIDSRDSDFHGKADAPHSRQFRLDEGGNWSESDSDGGGCGCDCGSCEEKDGGDSDDHRFGMREGGNSFGGGPRGGDAPQLFMKKMQGKMGGMPEGGPHGGDAPQLFMKKM